MIEPSKLHREEIEELLVRIRILIDGVAQQGSRETSQVLSAGAHQALLKIQAELDTNGANHLGSDSNLENAARVSAYYAESAKVLHDDLSVRALGTQSTSFKCEAALSEHAAELFRSLSYVALILSRSNGQLQLHPNHDEATALCLERMTTSDELKELVNATISRYEQGLWRTAAQAARKITPEIVELAAAFANRRMGKPLLQPGTNKPLEWIRTYKRSKVRSLRNL